MSGFSPAFQFYPGDWLSSPQVTLMTPEQEGAYIRLLCYAWADPDCSIPDDDEVLAKLSRLGEGWFNGGSTVLRKCFQPHFNQPGKLVNLRLLEERKKQKEWREKSRIGGLRSAESRARKSSKGGSRVVQPKGNSSSSFSSSFSIRDIHVESDDSTAPAKEKKPSEIEQVFDYWRKSLNHPTAKLTPTRRRRITDRLKDGYTVEDIQHAIDGCGMSPHNMGVNDTGTVYDDLELICRSGEKLERFLGIYNNKLTGGNNGASKPKHRETANQRAARETLELINGLTSADSGAHSPDSENSAPPRLLNAGPWER